MSNTIWNLLGLVLPAAVAVVTIPLIVGGYGLDRFGVLALAWLIIGYFGLFDLGIGRAMTKQVAEMLATNDASLVRVVWTGWYLMTAFGLVGGVLLATSVPLLLDNVVRVPEYLKAETRTALFFLAVGTPIVVLSASFRGLLEAMQMFRESTAVRLFTGLLMFGVPAILVRVTVDLAVVVAVLVSVRAIGAVAAAVLCFRKINFGGFVPLHGPSVRRLLTFGFWMTVSNLVSPILVSLDRFVIGATISIAAVAYYSAPSDAITRLLILPASLTGVLFPAFSTAWARDHVRLRELFWTGSTGVFFVLYPVVFALVALAPNLLDMWLGRDFAEMSSSAARWLAAGVLVNGPAQIAFSLVQGAGRSDLTAKIHLAEAPIYVVALIWATVTFGITGSAVVWCARVVVDFVLLVVVAGRLIRSTPSEFVLRMRSAAGLLPLLALGLVSVPIAAKLVLVTAVTVASAFLCWRTVLNDSQRAGLLRLARFA